MENTIFTIGYEKASIDDFIATLKYAEIATLLDVREVPLSRKSGFSKKSLASRLEGVGIKYLHLRDLGDPKPGREAARQGDMQKFETIFRTHMKSDKAQNALELALDAVSSGSPICLLCFECDPATCHRSIVAEAIKNHISCAIEHLAVQHGLSAEIEAYRQDNEPIYAVG